MAYIPAKTQSKLVTSYVIVRPKMTLLDGTEVKEEKIGMVQNLNPSERKDIVESWEIDAETNRPVPVELTPGLVRDRSLTCDRVALYTENVLKAFGGKSMQTIIDQNETFDIEERIKDPSTETTVTQKTYKDCYISTYDSTRDIGRGDIRELERVTIIYRTVEVPE